MTERERDLKKEYRQKDIESWRKNGENDQDKEKERWRESMRKTKRKVEINKLKGAQL